MDRTTRFGAALLAACLAVGCGGVRPTRFVHADFNFGYVERVAVLPFENLSTGQQAGARVGRLLATQLLATGAVEVIEPGEVRAALNRLSGTGYPLSSEQLLEVGRILDVQAVIRGSVNESQIVRSGTTSYPVVTLDVHMIEVETGTTVWATTHTEQGSSFGTRFLGTGGEPLTATTRECIKKIVNSLVQ